MSHDRESSLDTHSEATHYHLLGRLADDGERRPAFMQWPANARVVVGDQEGGR